MLLFSLIKAANITCGRCRSFWNQHFTERKKNKTFKVWTESVWRFKLKLLLPAYSFHNQNFWSVKDSLVYCNRIPIHAVFVIHLSPKHPFVSFLKKEILKIAASKKTAASKKMLLMGLYMYLLSRHSGIIQWRVSEDNA